MATLFRFACVLLVAAMACRKPEPAKPAAKKPAQAAPVDGTVVIDRDNLLDLAHGGVVLSRSGDFQLDLSAAHLLDGDPITTWKSPPRGAQQTAVFALPAPARITSVGVVAPSERWDLPIEVRIELSADGTTWREVASMKGFTKNERRFAEVPLDIFPNGARFVRLQLPDDRRYYSVLRSLIVKGQELAPAKMPDIAGCWTINGMPANFTQRGTRVTGVIGGVNGDGPPMFVSGARNDRTVRLMWSRGPQWGFALLTIDPQRRALSGIRWHESVSTQGNGDGWFGEPAPCVPMLERFDVQITQTILERAGRWVAYGDDSLATIAELESRGVKLRRVTRPALPADATEPQRVMGEGVEVALADNPRANE